MTHIKIYDNWQEMYSHMCLQARTPSRNRKKSSSPKKSKSKSPSRRAQSQGRTPKKTPSKSRSRSRSGSRGRKPQSQTQSQKVHTANWWNVFENEGRIQKRTPSRSSSRSRKESSVGKTPRSINIPKSVTSTLQRASRSIERRVTPVVSDVKRLLRDSSSSRVNWLNRRGSWAVEYVFEFQGPVSRSYSTRNGAGRMIPSMDAVRAKSRQLWLQAKRNQREIFVTLALLLLVALIVYSVLHSDPAKVTI